MKPTIAAILLLCGVAGCGGSPLKEGDFVEDCLTRETGIVTQKMMSGKLIVRFKDGRRELLDPMELYGTGDPLFDQ